MTYSNSKRIPRFLGRTPRMFRFRVESRDHSGSSSSESAGRREVVVSTRRKTPAPIYSGLPIGRMMMLEAGLVAIIDTGSKLRQWRSIPVRFN